MGGPPPQEEVGRWGAQQDRETRPLRRPRPERLFGAPERGNKYLVQVEGHLNASGGLSSELTLTWDRTGVPGGSEISFFFLEPFRGSPGGCPSRPSCLSCLADLGCAWCPPSSSCHPRHPSPTPPGVPCGDFGADSGDFGGPRLVLHPQNCVLCEEHRDCRSCAGDPFCEWQTLGPPDSKRGDFVCSRRGRQGGAVRDPQKCPPLCSSRTTCSECLAPPSQCAWCPSTQRCFLFAAYLARYPYGGCRGWSDSVHSAPQCRGCSELRSCRECLSQHGCGWCGSGRNPALGSCFEGDFSGPRHFPNCSAALASTDRSSDHLSDHRSDHQSDHLSDQQSDHSDVRSEHLSDRLSEHRSDHRSEQRTDQQSDRSDVRSEHRSDRSDVQSEHLSEHLSDRSSDQRSDQRSDHLNDHPSDRSDARSDHPSDHWSDRSDVRSEHRSEHLSEHRSDQRSDHLNDHRSDRSDAQSDHWSDHRSDHLSDRLSDHQSDRSDVRSDQRSEHLSEHLSDRSSDQRSDHLNDHPSDRLDARSDHLSDHRSDQRWSYGSCPDVDECELGLARCHPRARCHNSPGSFECRCPRGFQGDGVTSCEPT